jgi:transcriptional regulator with XRE-family HTH domain
MAKGKVGKTVDNLGDYLKEQRTAARLSLRQLSEQAGVSNPYLSQIERGLHEPSVRVLKAIAGALNLSAEQLLVQAGVLEGVEHDVTPPPSVEDAVNADPKLTKDQRAALMSVYRSFVETEVPAKRSPPKRPAR